MFLVGYVTHKALVRGVHTPFGGEGAIRTVYYTMLLTHVVLAMAIAYLVPRTFWLAIRGDYERHRAWARWRPFPSGITYRLPECSFTSSSTNGGQWPLPLTLARHFRHATHSFLLAQGPC